VGRIINLSLGVTSSSGTLESAVNYAYNKGSFLVGAAGNNGNSTPVYPAAYANVMAVSALNKNDSLPSWSNCGSYVAISAPGEAIVTTWSGNRYTSISGTSFASPIVAGVGSLILSLNPQLSNKSVADILTSTADDLGATGYDIYFGVGRVNASRAVGGDRGGIEEEIDNVDPITQVTNPKDGASIAKAKSGNVSVSSSDNIGVVRAEIYINGRLMATSSSASFTYKWNTHRLAKGSYQIQSRAYYDKAGNVGFSPLITVYR
jgi:thermitase